MMAVAKPKPLFFLLGTVGGLWTPNLDFMILIGVFPLCLTWVIKSDPSSQSVLQETCSAV